MSVYRTIGPLVSFAITKALISCVITVQLISAFFLWQFSPVFVETSNTGFGMMKLKWLGENKNLKKTLVRGGILKIFSGDILKKQLNGYKKVLDHYINVPVQ